MLSNEPSPDIDFPLIAVDFPLTDPFSLPLFSASMLSRWDELFFVGGLDCALRKLAPKVRPLPPMGVKPMLMLLLLLDRPPLGLP